MSGGGRGAPADAILEGGTIVTMDAARPSVEAVALRGSRIAAAGTRAEVAQWRGARTRVESLDGATLLPGFIEAHGHPLMSALAWGDGVVDIRAIHVPTWDAAVEKMRRRVARAAPGEVLWFIGMDPQLHRGLREPTKAELDRLAPNNPVVVQTSNLHALYVNTAALAAFGIDRGTPAPGAGAIAPDENGEPWKFTESATLLFREPFYARGGPGQVRQELDGWLDRFARAGYTTSTEIGLLPDWSAHYADRVSGGGAPIRVYAYERLFADRPIVARADAPVDDWFATIGVKLWADGSPFVGNIWVGRPYLNTSLTLGRMGLPRDSTGHMNWRPDEFAAQVRRAAADGWQVAVHAQGDRTIDVVLDAFEDALRDFPRARGPFRLEHCVLIRDDQLERARDLGVAVSLFLPHLWYWGEVVRDEMLGPEVAARYAPNGSAARLGVRASYHCDSPMTWPNALLCLHIAVNRVSRAGATIGPGERVDVETALRALTVDAAWQLQAEDRLGSITPGKLADFTLLSEDPRGVDPMRILDIPVLGTWVGGRRVWSGCERAER